jgi:putative methyltransferase (TIGR04325 family)
VLFDEPAYPFELLTAILRLGLRDQRAVRVLDFGGSLGSTYRQCRPLLDGVRGLRWTVVEQPDFVSLGNREFATAELAFAATLEEGCADGPPDLILASGVLQYLEDPAGMFRRLLAIEARTLLLDRTPMTGDAEHSLCIQHVPASIYEASYPCWLLSRRRLRDQVGPAWQLVCDFPCHDGEWRSREGTRFEFRGLMLERAAAEETR